MANLCLGKAVMVISNALFLVSGLAAVTLGALLLSDAPRVLMSRLVLSATSALAAPQPLLYYASLAAMGLGLVVCAVAVLGCWASCLHSYCIMGTYLFLLTLLLLTELSVGALAALGPQFLGLAIEKPRLTDALQRGYGVPGREQFTAALDLAQVSLRCCGVTGGSDFQASWWRLRELGQRDLLVPLSCCELNNAQDADGFLDPRPVNLTLCQSLHHDVARPQRHMEGCSHKLNLWLGHQVQLLGAAGGILVLVQLLALLAAILVCVQLPRCRERQRQLQEQRELQLRLTPRSENGFLDFDHTADKFTRGGDTPPGDNNNTPTGTCLTGRLYPTHAPRADPDRPLAGPQHGPRHSGLVDMVEATVYHLPMPTEITPAASPVGPLHMGSGSPVVGKYVTAEEVVYHHTDSGALKYTLPSRRSHRDAGKPPKPPPKPTTLPYDLCNCDLQNFYPACYADAVEPSPYQYVEELRASPYQQALVYHQQLHQHQARWPKPDPASKPPAEGEPTHPQVQTAKTPAGRPTSRRRAERWHCSGRASAQAAEGPASRARRARSGAAASRHGAPTPRAPRA